MNAVRRIGWFILFVNALTASVHARVKYQGGADAPATSTLVGRYAKGANVIRIEAFDNKLLALPLWWGGMQPLDRRAGPTFEMQNRREAVFTFTTSSLRVTGHRELDGTYRKLGSELAPLEALLAGEKNSAYRGLRALGLHEKTIVQLVKQCLVNQPSRRKVLYDFVKYLLDQGLKGRDLMHLAAFAAVAAGDRPAAVAWYKEILKEKSDDADALSPMRMMGQIPTSGGWKLPFPLADACAPPTAAELARVRSEWKSRDLVPRDTRKEHETHLNVNGVALQATVISYRIHSQRNFGVVLVPVGAKNRSCPVLVELKGVSPSYFPLRVPGGILTPSILGADLRKFVVFLPAVRGEQLLFDGKTYQCEGDPDDSWDGATDDAISFITAGLEFCPQADANRIVAFGKSRGGAVAMLLGERDPRVRAIVSWSGPVGWIENMTQMGWSQFELVREGLSTQAPPNSPAGQAIRTFFKPAISGKMNLIQTRDRLIASSPIYFVSHLPPAQLHYGANDFTVATEEGRSIEAILARLGSKRPDISVLYEEDGGHDLNPRISVPTTKDFLLKYTAEEASPDLGDDALRGTWQVVSVEREGQISNDDIWIIQKDKISFKRDNFVYEEASYKVDSAKRPKTIDLKFTAGPAQAKPVRGIYIVDHDELKICYVAPDRADAEKRARPSEFSAAAGSGTWLFVLKRVKP
jgi:uncharacterized protein (TIGR03067 family)